MAIGWPPLEDEMTRKILGWSALALGISAYVYFFMIGMAQ